MPNPSTRRGSFVLCGYRGDAKTLLAFDLDAGPSRKNLAGFTVLIAPPGVPPYFLQNDLRFEQAEKHAQDPTESAYSTINAPIHKFRWVHVPGIIHQGLKPAFGLYRYSVTPRYFDDAGSLQSLDPALTAAIDIEVAPFEKDKVKLAFTRGFVQSQAFVRHFGLKAKIQPAHADLTFDTSAISGSNAQGESYTYLQQYEWLGFTARACIFELVQSVLDDPTLSLDLFAYDLREPDFIKALIELGKQKRARVILDNAGLHHSTPAPKPEDKFEALFAAAAGADRIKRGDFDRYSHDKVIVVSDATGPLRVLTGSTNFAVTGIYVNSNHVLVFDDRDVAKLYAGMFQKSWDVDLNCAAFAESDFATERHAFGGNGLPPMEITFSPHAKPFAREILTGLVDRIAKEEQGPPGKGSILFAVMELGGGKDNPVYEALSALHARQDVFSFGISDDPDGIAFYPVGQAHGVLVTGKPGATQLPPPFSQVPGIGFDHQVHHKFVVCGFNGDDPTLYCGSSNLALAGECANGDNLLAIRDGDIATAFAIEALALVDHFNFLDGLAKAPAKPAAGLAPAPAAPPTAQRTAAVSAGWFLGTSDLWAAKYFDPNDLHCKDRVLFAG